MWLWGVSELAVSFLLWLYGPSLKRGVFREEVVTPAGTCAEILPSTGVSLPSRPQGEVLKKRAAGSLCSPAPGCSALCEYVQVAGNGLTGVLLRARQAQVGVL